ncbi:MAG: DUF1501 domain-containing protein [Chloroflexota bacterium]
MLKTTRRGFMIGCSSAIAAMAGARLNFAAFGSADQEPNQNIFVYIFLRGGMDVLNFLTPMGGEDRGHYEAARPDLALPVSGNNSLLQLGNNPFGLHPSAAPLVELYNSNAMTFVMGTGLEVGTRSHFDAMAHIELGTNDSTSSSSGWITRHLQTSGIQSSSFMESLATGNLRPDSLRGKLDVVGMNNPNDLQMNQGHWKWREAQRTAMRNFYANSGSALHESGVNALNAADIIEASAIGGYDRSGYPSGSFGSNLASIAQMIKLQLGLRVATVDLGGWDTHERQVNGSGENAAEGFYADRVRNLSEGLHAFYSDLWRGGDYAKRVSVVIMSEFGRRVQENANRGTDHGHGSLMMVMGGGVNGGQLYGQFPGLHLDQLYDNRDLDVTTDYRNVLSELLIERMGNNSIDQIFPGFTNYQPMGLFGSETGQLPTPTPGPDATDAPANTPAPGETPDPNGTPTPLPTVPASLNQKTYFPLVNNDQE